jgi:regulator of protease activity HflC (stomatin/prohibitin superfamily)
MSWQVITFIVIGCIAAIIFAVSLFLDDAAERRGARVIGGAAFSVALIFIVFGCFTIVGTRQIAIQTSFGRPVGEAFSNGLHTKAPWTITHEMDGAIQIDKYTKEGDGAPNDHRILVRLGNSSTAQADASIRWQMKQSAAPELYQQYKTFDNVRVNLVERNLAVALNRVFASFDPLAPQNLDRSPLPDLANQATEILRHEVGAQVEILDINIPTISYDQGTEDKINQLNQQRAQTSIAAEAQKTAEQQRQANNILSQSISHDPNVIVQNCITAAIGKGISPLGCWPGVNAVPTVPAK